MLILCCVKKPVIEVYFIQSSSWLILLWSVVSTVVLTGPVGADKIAERKYAKKNAFCRGLCPYFLCNLVMMGE